MTTSFIRNGLEKTQKILKKPLISHVNCIFIIHKVPTHNHTLNGGNTNFYEGDEVCHICFNVKITSYEKILLFSTHLQSLLIGVGNLVSIGGKGTSLRCGKFYA